MCQTNNIISWMRQNVFFGLKPDNIQQFVCILQKSAQIQEERTPPSVIFNAFPSKWLLDCNDKHLNIDIFLF